MLLAAPVAAEDSDMIPPLGGGGGSGGGPVSGGWMECSIYQNYSASEVFVQGLAGVVNQQARDQGHLVHSFTF